MYAAFNIVPPESKNLRKMKTQYEELNAMYKHEADKVSCHKKTDKLACALTAQINESGPARLEALAEVVYTLAAELAPVADVAGEDEQSADAAADGVSSNGLASMLDRADKCVFMARVHAHHLADDAKIEKFGEGRGPVCVERTITLQSEYCQM